MCWMFLGMGSLAIPMLFGILTITVVIGALMIAGILMIMIVLEALIRE